jgi:hypothetical protein
MVNTQYFTLGLNIYFEIDANENIFSYRFSDGKLSTRLSVSENELILAEKVNKYQFDKAIERRLRYFTKKFK